MADASTAPAAKPSRVGGLLSLVRKLVDYGTFLADTIRRRGLGNHPRFHGRQFGTTSIALILARIARALLRAAALEARLIRGAHGLDAPPRPPRARPPADAAAAPSAPRPRAGPRHIDDDALAHMPTPEQIAAAIRHQPIGQVIADICRDLGIIPAHPLWRELSRTITHERGRFAAMVIDILQRKRRVPITEDWPQQPPPDLWATWRYSPEPAGTGPP
jgi:hypothetical protein